MRAEDVGVEDEHACGAKALAGDAVVLARSEPARRDERATDQRADDDAHGWRDQVVLEGILHEKDNTEEKDEAADPGEELHPKEAFPIDWRSSRTRRWGGRSALRQRRNRNRKRRWRRRERSWRCYDD